MSAAARLSRDGVLQPVMREALVAWLATGRGATPAAPHLLESQHAAALLMALSDCKHADSAAYADVLARASPHGSSRAGRSLIGQPWALQALVKALQSVPDGVPGAHELLSSAQDSLRAMHTAREVATLA